MPKIPTLFPCFTCLQPLTLAKNNKSREKRYFQRVFRLIAVVFENLVMDAFLLLGVPFSQGGQVLQEAYFGEVLGVFEVVEEPAFHYLPSKEEEGSEYREEEQ